MSYILDALSKSQRERERTTVPTLTTDFPVQPAKRRASKFLVGGAVGVLATGVLVAAFGLYARAPAPQASRELMTATVQPSPAPAATTAPLTAAADVRERFDTPQHRPETQPPAIAPESRVRARRTESVSPPKERALSKNTAATKEASIPETARVAGASQPSDKALSDPRLSEATRWLVKEMAALEQNRQSGESGTQESPARQAKRIASTSAGTAETRESPMHQRVAAIHEQDVPADTDPGNPSPDAAPTLAELPPEARSAIPALEVNVHTYAKTSEGRMVFINMKRYGEGDRLAEGPVIDAITPDGVVLVHEHQRFRLPAR